MISPDLNVIFLHSNKIPIISFKSESAEVNSVFLLKYYIFSSNASLK